MTTTSTPCVLDASPPAPHTIPTPRSAPPIAPSRSAHPPTNDSHAPVQPEPRLSTPNPFNPDPDTADRLLEDLASNHDSLLAISKAYGATLDGLCEWMQRPETAVRIARISAAAAHRAHLAASIQLPKCVVVLVDMIKGYHHQETHDPIRNDLKQCRLRETQRDNARKAINLLYTFHRIGVAPRPTAGSGRSAPDRSALRADAPPSATPHHQSESALPAALLHPNPATPPDPHA